MRFHAEVIMNPDFLIIGAQKCATSWLHVHLGQHPQIMLPAEKDIEFFSYPVNLNPETSRAWLERFDDAPEGVRIGDVNGAYFWTESGSPWGVKLDSFNRHIPESVQAFLGDEIQLIVSLRNPVERAVSAYLHHIHHRAIVPEQKLLDIEAPLGIVDMGFYGAHLENWLRVFPAKQFLVIRGLPFNHRSATRLLSGTLEFLAVDDFQQENTFETPVYPGIQRIFRQDGVWVDMENPSIARHLPLNRNAPQMEEEGTAWIRLIDDSELTRLQQIFEQDQILLNKLLTGGGISVLEV